MVARLLAQQHNTQHHAVNMQSEYRNTRQHFAFGASFFLNLTGSCENKVRVRVNLTESCPNSINVDRYVFALQPPSVCVCCHSNETRAPIANPPNSTEPGDTPTIFQRYIRVRAVGTNTHTDTQMAVINMHFA